MTLCKVFALLGYGTALIVVTEVSGQPVSPISKVKQTASPLKYHIYPNLKQQLFPNSTSEKEEERATIYNCAKV